MVDNTDIIPFDFDGKPVRVVMIDGEPHFVGKDVAERLGYTNAADAITQHCKGVAKRYPLQTGGGTQEVRVLSEPDVLRLIVRSKLPGAERFERLVFEEILPTIRKTGGFGVPVFDPHAMLNDPAAMRGILLTYTEKVIALEGQVEEMRPQVQALDRIANADGSTCITDAAKMLQVRPKDLFAYLRQNGWIYRRAGSGTDLGYQSKILAGFLEHKVKIVPLQDGSDKETVQVRVTPKGLARLARMLPPAVSEAA